MAHSEQTLRQEEIYAGRVLRLTRDTVRLENGAEGEREVVHHHGGACVLALTPQREVYLVRQYRYAIGREMWELPAGKLEPDEDPFAAARRELTEEAGVTADNWRSLGAFYPTVGYCTEAIHLYVATGLHPAAMHLDDDEFLEPSRCPLSDLVRRVLSGEIQDAKTIIGCLKVQALLENGELTP